MRIFFVILIAVSQIGSVWLPKCFEPVDDNLDDFDAELCQLLCLAVPRIAQILVLMDDKHPVIHHYREYFKGHPRTATDSIDWMRSCSFNPTPALDALMAEPLAALARHKHMESDGEANRKMWGPGSVLFQLLVIQHSLGENWNLNGDTFTHIQDGLIIPSLPHARHSLDAMWAAIDPRAAGMGEKVNPSKLAAFEAKFKADHTIYYDSSALVFYCRVKLPGEGIQRSSIRIRYQQRDIVTVADLPPRKPQPEKRKFEGGEVFESEDLVSTRPTKRGKGKYQPKPTPPGARRSRRLQTNSKQSSP